MRYWGSVMMMMMMMMMMYRCWFGEKHPSTGNETWKVEVCQDNEDHCYQVSQAEGTQGRGQGVVQCLYPYLLVDKIFLLMLMTLNTYSCSW